MKQLPKVDRRDWQFVKPQADDNFDPERNKQVIENSIKKYEAMRRKKMQEHTDGVEERAQALAFYMKHKGKVGSESEMTKYFGKSYMSYLKGDIMKRIQNGLRVLSPDGRVVRDGQK
jgi:hypothetical protein